MTVAASGESLLIILIQRFAAASSEATIHIYHSLPLFLVIVFKYVLR